MGSNEENVLVVPSEVDSTSVEMPEVETPPETPPVETAGAEVPAKETEPPEADQTVPKDRLDAVINENKELKSRLDLVEQNNALAAANAPAPQQAEFDIYKHLGISEDNEDAWTGEQIKAVREYDRKVTDAKLDEVNFLASNPDFLELVGTAEGIAKNEFAPALSAALKADPTVLTKILQSKNPKAAALLIARGVKLEPETTGDEESVIEEAVKNAKRPKSSQTVRGGGPLGAEHRVLTMSDDAFIKLARSRGANV